MSTKNKQVDNPKYVHIIYEQSPVKKVNFFDRVLSCPFSSTFHQLVALVCSRIYNNSFTLKLILAAFLMFSSFSTSFAQDFDSDGVLDAVDWCPTQGGTVNAFGCPFPIVCDTIETTNISFDTSGMNLNVSYQTIFVLADSVGVIVDTSSAPQFLNVTAGKYMVLALDYVDDGSLANFAIADTITEASANCFEWSAAITYRICPAEICGNGNDDDEDGDTDCADSDCPNPAANATSSGPVCEGENLLLDEEGGEGVSWTWSGPSGASSNSKSFGLGSVTASNAGTYSVTVTGASDCTTVSTVDVVINTEPVVSFTAPADLCMNSGTQTGLSGGLPASTYSGFVRWDLNAVGFADGGIATGYFNYNVGTNSLGDWNIAVVSGNVATFPDTVYNPVTATNFALASNLFQFRRSTHVTRDFRMQITTAATDAGGNILLDVVGNPGSNIECFNCSPGRSISFGSIDGTPIWTTIGTFSGLGVTDNGDGTYDFDPATAGVGTHTITYTYTDANGCIGTATDDIVVNATPTATAGSNSAICVGEDLDLTESGGAATGWSWTGPNSFTSTAQNPTITTATALAAGTYNLTITDVNGCTATSNTTVTINTAPTITVGSNSAICVGEDLDLTETGGAATGWSWTGPNSFTSTAQNPTITTATALAAGAYNLTITDANGCTATSNTLVTINTAPTITIGSNSAICVGEDLDLTESGGAATGWSWTGPNSFTSTAQNPTITTATALAAGTYNLTITDVNGCTATSNTSVTINTAPTITVGSNSAICVGEDLDLTESGGAATGWSWTGPNSFTSTAQNPTITTATALAAGTYNLTITDVNGCTATSNTTVTINTAPTITVGSNSAICVGEDLDLTESGGAATGWSWTGPNSFTSSAQNPTITSATALAAGTYNLTITDVNGCTSTSNTTVTVNENPTITIGGNSPICAGEDLDITESGGAATGWSWTGPNSFSSTAQNPTISTATVAADGLYSLTITDANGCTAVSTIDIGVFAEPALNTPVVNNPTSCGGADGNITINATGGTGSYEYNIDGGAWGSSNSFNGLSAGSYVIGLRNDNGTCEVFTGSIVLSDPSSPTATTTMPAATCQGTAASFTAVDAGVGATYSWDFGVGATPATATGIGPHSVTYSSSGTKTVDLEVTLAGCTASDSDSYTVHALPTATLTPLDTTVCANAPNIVFTAPTGMANYVWSITSGDASVIGAPSTNSIEINPETTDFTLAVTITDGNGCTSVAQSTTTLFPIPTVTLGSNSPICAGNNINITETGGDADTWSWTGPNGFTSTAQNPSITGATTAASGDYFVTVTDANSCTVVNSINVVVNAGAIVTTGSNSPICVTDSLKLTESGGDAVGWSWTGPNSFSSTEQNPNIENSNVNANGTYFVTITDANSCTNVDSVAVVVNYLPAINIASNGPICEGDSLMLTEDGGDATGWLWGGPNSFTSTEQNPNIANTTALANGTYNVTITNGNSCTEVASVAVTVYTPPSITGVSSTDPTSCTVNDGTITVSASAGTGGIEYRVDGGTWQGTGNFTGLAVGSHTVEIRNDNSFCIVPHSSGVVLSNPASPTAEITVPAIVCQGETASFTATDAGVGATYAWDFGAGATPATATGIGPHDVTYASDGSKAIGLEVTSVIGCVATDSEPYTVYVLPVVNLVLADDDACVSETAITLSGGNPTGGTYSGTGVEGDGVTFNPSTATAGVHTITYTYTDANGCVNTNTDDFEVYALPSITFTLSDDEACVDEAAFTLSGGLPAIGLYSGTGVAVDGLTFDPATAGVGTHTITYTVTDPNGCVSTLTDDITVHALPVVTLPLTDDEACVDDGTLTLGGGNPSGGTYSGANVSGTTFNVATAGVGTHTVTYTYTDPTTTCTNSATADIEVHALPTPTLSLGIDEACVSETTVALTGGSGIVANGSYSGTAVSGSGPYVFNPSIAGVGTHTITYTYTDGNGCVNTTTDDIEVFALPVVSLVLGDDIACVDEATITLSGGSPSGGTFSGAHVSGNTFDVAAAGQGTHTVTYSYTDANGCINTGTDDIIIFSIPTVVSATPTHLAVCGINDGTITVTGTSGSGSYEFRINGGAWQSTTVFTALSAGDYNIEIRNDNGTCLSSFTSNPVTINEPPGATITVAASVTSSYTGEDVTCFGASDGTATAVAATGAAPYTYDWSNGQTGPDLINVPAGTYFVTATDFTNCEAITTIEITQPDSISAGAILTHVSCFGGSDGAIDLNVTGGVNAFTYGWDDLTTEAFYNFDDNTDDQTGNGHHRTGGAGLLNYSTDVVFGSGSFYFDGSTSLQYDDNAGFMETTFRELTIQMWIKPDDLSGQKVLFEEGEFINGISFGLTNDQLNVVVIKGFAQTFSSPVTFPNDGQWHHVGFVFDKGLITVFLDGIMGGTVDVGYTEVLLAGLGVWNSSGIGGVFGTDAFGFFGGAQYKGLMDNFSYHRDALTVNAISDSFDDDGDRDGLSAGDYDVLVTDLNGCNTTITVTITEPDELLLDTIPSEVNCFGGSDGAIDLIVTGGTTPYSYNWSNGETTQDVNGLLPGVYDVTVTDNNGCTAITQSTIVQPDSLVATAAITSDLNGLPLSCSGASDGAVEATATAGRLPYTYLWDTGATTAEVTGLSADTYIVTITDDNGCTAVDSVTINDPPLVTVSITKDIAYGTGDVSCLNATDGAVTAVGADGVAPFTYEWSDGQSTATATGLGVGTYTVTVRDLNLCTNTASVTLVNPTVIDPNISITSNYNGEDVSCPAASDGAVYVEPTGGGGTYTYEWAHDNTLPFSSDSLTGLLATAYTVTVTDQFGCTAEASATLQNPSAVTSSITNNNLFSGFEVSCNGGADGNITANAGGGVGSYTYQWARNGTGIAPTTANITSVGEGTYTVTVSDANGCTSISNIDLTEPTPITFTAITSPPGDCGEATGIILVSASGGTGSFEYSIDGGVWQSSNAFFGLLNGTYDIRVRNQFGTCASAPTSVIVEVADAPVINNTTIIHPSTGASTDGGILVGASGKGLGTGLSLEYRLNGVTGWQSLDHFENLPVGTYTLEVRYSGQICITTQVLTLVAGQGVESSGTTLSFCSGDATATQLVETYYIPGPEDDLLNTFQSIYDADGSACGSAGAEDPVNPISTYVSIGIVESGTIIYYDHWEDGYEQNLSFPTTAPITQVWGDNDATNGIPPGFAVDYLSAADIIILSNDVDVNDLTGTSPYLYNGGDIIGSRGNISVTRLAWATGSGTLFAGALEVYPQETWGTDYTFPVGEDTDVNLMFSYTGAIVMAKEDGTVVNYVDNGTAQTATLAKGESLHIDGGIDAGDQVTASAPIQVHLLTGGYCQTFSSRFFTLKPTDQWASDYYNPVATINNNSSTSSSFNKPTYVHLYNPDPVNSITVSWESNTAGVNTIPVGSNGTAFVQIPEGTGTHFYTTNGANFYAIATIDSDPGINYGADWGFALLPGNQLTSQITMVGFAPGADPNTLGTDPENSSPIWITADYPPGSASSGDITICIDHDGDGGSSIDGNGISYDESFDLGELDIAKIYDPDDNDQTGTRIWVCDGSDAIIAGAYGQDPATASGPLPAIDLGTGLPNGIPYSISKCANLSNDLNGNGKFDECDEVTYTIMVRNTGALPLSTGSLTLIDTLASELTYVDNSTIAIIGNSFTALLDDDSPASAFPFDEAGYQHNTTVLPGDSIQFQFAVVINDLPYAALVNNTAYAASNGEALNASVTFPVETPVSPVLDNIPNDTIVTCGNVPAIPFQDTCQSIGLLSQYTWLLEDADSEASVAFNGEKAFDGSINSYWLTGSVGTTGCTDVYVSSIEDETGVGNSTAVLGAPDGVGAELHEQSDQLTLDLGEVVAPGNTYTFTWRRGLSTGSNPEIFIYESSDDINYYLRSDGPYTTSNTTFFTETFAAEYNVRYIRVITQNVYDIDIDALSFESGCVSGAGTSLPHNLDIDLGAMRDISGFQYTPRQDDVAGRVEDFEFYVSTDGASWGAPVITGTYTGGTSPEIVNFPSVTGRYVRFVAISAIDGNEYTAVAELDVFACLITTTFAETNEQTNDGSCTDFDYDIYRVWTTIDFCGNVFLDSQYIQVQDLLSPTLNNVPTDITVSASAIPVPPLTDCSLQTNIALGRPTTQIDTTNSGVPDRAVDGNTDGDYSNNSVTNTSSTFQPWWQVELDSVYEIDYVNLYNRTDCCPTRMSDFYVLVSSEPFTSDVLATNIADPDIHSVYFSGMAGMPSSISINAIGRYVRVQLSGTNEMNMAEFEVFPTCVSASDACDPDPVISFVETTSPIGCTYTITRTWTATDACGHSSEQTQTIDVSSTLSTLVEVTFDHNSRDISCVGGSDGEANVTINAGIAPLTYLWSGGETTNVVTGLGAGTHRVTITDGLGCQVIDSVTLIDPPPLNANPTITSNYNGEHIRCFDGSDGTAFVSATGGTGMKTFLWSTGATTNALTGLGAGTYIVTATDANGCIDIDSITLVEPTELALTMNLDNPLACVGDSDGEISVSVLGGTGTYIYIWSNFNTSNSITGLPADMYLVTVTDQNGCTAIDSLALDDPAPLVVNFDISSDPSLCEALDGDITISGSGGSGSFEYSQSMGGPWSNTTNYNGLAAGIYDFYIRNADGTCPTGPFSDTLVNPIPSTCPIFTNSTPLIVCNTDISIPFHVTDVPGDTSYFWQVPFGMSIVSGQGTDSIVVSADGIAVGTYNICMYTRSNCGDSELCCLSFDVILCTEICNNLSDDDADGLVDCDDPDCGTIAEITLPSPACVNESASFTALDGGSGATYAWDFGAGASPATATGIGPHSVTYSSCGSKSVSLDVARGTCTDSETESFTVADTEAPTADALPAIGPIACYTDAPPAHIDSVKNVADNCSTVAVSIIGDTADPGCSGVVTRTYRLTDVCGNTTDLEQFISINDNVGPTFTTPADTTLYLNNSCALDSTTTSIGTVMDAADNCNAPLTIGYFDNLANLSLCSSTGTFDRVWTVTDACGNPTTQIQTVTIADTLGPVFVSGVPADVSVECDAIPSLPNPAIDFTLTDNCGTVASVTLTGNTSTETASGACTDNQYTITRTWTATDACGNTTTAQQIISVDDTSPPAFTVPADTTLYLSASCSIDTTTASIGTVTGTTDACSSTFTATYVDDVTGLLGCNNTGSFTRTWTVTDACGNPATQTQTVTIQDTISPTFITPIDTIVFLDVNCLVDTTITSIGQVTVSSDNCSGPLTIDYVDVLTNLSGCNATGTFTRTWTVTDACGNSNTGVQTVSIQDNTVPSADPLPDLGPFDCYDDIPAADITDVQNPTDNCAGTTTVSHVGDSAPVAGCSNTVIRTYRVTDACGNTSDLTQNIFIDQSGIAVGGLTVDTTTICLSNAFTGTIGATPDGNAVVPCNNTILYVLSTGAGLTIIDTSSTPDFALTAVGDYAIHTLIYDTVATSVNYLDLSVLNFGVTQLSTVEALLEQGGGAICGALDMIGAAANATSCSATLGDFVWEDQNEDGIQNSGEPGIEGVTVTLFDSSDNLIATTTTAANGSYIFNAIPSGTYYIVFDVSTNVNAITVYVGTQRNVGSPLTDSDINAATERTHLFIFDTSLGNILTIDAGYILSCPPAQRGGVNVIRK